jgi:hypothetical protein
MKKPVWENNFASFESDFDLIFSRFIGWVNSAKIVWIVKFKPHQIIRFSEKSAEICAASLFQLTLTRRSTHSTRTYESTPLQR